jgi:hypothetical protein
MSEEFDRDLKVFVAHSKEDIFENSPPGLARSAGDHPLRAMPRLVDIWIGRVEMKTKNLLTVFKKIHLDIEAAAAFALLGSMLGHLLPSVEHGSIYGATFAMIAGTFWLIRK